MAKFHYCTKKGKKTDPNNWRGISLTNELLKLFETVIANRLELWAEQNLDLSCQTAFRKGYSVLENPITLECMVRNMRQGKLFVALVDLCKAFPSVCRYLLLKKLESIGISDMMMVCLSNLYVNDSFGLLYGGETLGKIDVARGLKEGSCLSPILFLLLYVSDLPSFLSNSSSPIDAPVVGGCDIYCMQFADDVVLLAKSQHGLQNLVERFELYCELNGLKVNPTKTIFLSFPNFSRRFSFTISGVRRNADKFGTYLGTVVCSGKNRKMNLETRLNKSRVAFSSLLSACSRLKISNVRFSVELYKSLVLSTMSYSIFLNLPHPYFSKLESFHVGCLRKLLRLPCSTRKEMVLRISGVPCLKCFILRGFSNFLFQLCTRENPSLALAAVRDLWEEERLFGTTDGRTWRTETFFNTLSSWSDTFCSNQGTQSWENFVCLIREIVTKVEGSNLEKICQSCMFSYPLTREDYFFTSCVLIENPSKSCNFQSLTNETRILLLFVTNSWRYSGIFSKYSFLSKYRTCCSLTQLILDSPCHAFDCHHGVRSTRLDSLNHQLNTIRAMNSEPHMNEFDIDTFIFCFTSDSYGVVTIDFVNNFFELRKREWDTLGSQLCSLV